VHQADEYIARAQLQAWAYITRTQLEAVRAKLLEGSPTQTLDFDNLPIGDFERALALWKEPVLVLLMDLWQVVKAINKLHDLPPRVRALHDADLYERVKLHRDVREHWEEHERALGPRATKPLGGAAKKFRGRFPDGIPYAMSYNAVTGDFTIGAVQGEITSAEINALLDRVDAATGLGPGEGNDPASTR
jgi:hypothetical protein